MSLAGRLGGRPEVAPFPGWSFGQPRRVGPAYLARRTAWKLARKLRSSYLVVAPWLYGTRMEFVLASDIGRCVWVAGCFEPNEMYLLSQLLSSGGTFVDVGANVGLYSVAAASMVGLNGRVLAFEPSPRSASFWN